MLRGIIMFIGGSITMFFGSIFCGIFFLPYIWNGTSLQTKWRKYRQSFAGGPLGLKNRPGRKGPKHHSILDVDKHKTMDHYIKSLCRSAKTNMKQCEKKFKKNAIVHVLKNDNWTFTLDHMKVTPSIICFVCIPLQFKKITVVIINRSFMIIN